MPVSPSTLNARARLANYVGSGARRERETGGASERVGKRVSGLSVRPSLPDFANSVRRPFKTATVCAPLVGREREEGGRGDRERVGQRGGKRGRERLKFKVVVALLSFLPSLVTEE